ncbi:hypothetical protein SR42_08970 [Clostridium botulinum]|uniref:hypothetical protein n=1 Tax=Clostridium botulinum TaxID=1491 RepID=UPI0005975A4D|nr:hypothetical protein [Clostridium botulinum]KIL09089.1 hypothetical protein SR42_08970 [Clostridium botulinum]MBY6932781.1 hypothetical protein [Clostridium botulinum]NFL81650.1 hypothetical protein [Clostridium botulinum]NFN10936.1 hypothetical protein [Clostridium botulinum]NFO35931.1 hypothetical protein [Clostridium botulinum]
MREKKHRILIRMLPVIILTLIVLGGITKVNIINTKSLSPLGNTKQNYELVSEEFGEDFSNFIKDNSTIKIYKEDNKQLLIRIGNKDLRINEESIFTQKLKNLYNKISINFTGLKENAYNFTHKFKE